MFKQKIPRVCAHWGPLLLLAGYLGFVRNLAGIDILISVLAGAFIFDVCYFPLSFFSSRNKETSLLRHTLYLPRFLLGLLLIVCIGKTVAVVYGRLPRDIIFQPGEREDLFLRRDFLTSRILNSDFGPRSSPGFLSEPFQEEWAIGTLSMFAAALTNLAYRFPEIRADHVVTIRQMIDRMLLPDIREYEKRYWGEDALESLNGDKGHIGYLGHLNLMLGMHRLLGGGSEFDTLHESISNTLARRLEQRKGFFLETFPDQIYIPDNAVVLASLALFDRSRRSDKFDSTVHRWIENAKSKLLDPDVGVLVPWVNADGEPVGKPRGSYATWNVFYINQFDRVFAKSQAHAIEKWFRSSLPFGACGIREYLPGVRGNGDIDSGPVLFGLSTSGTGFGLSSAKILQEAEFSHCLLLTAEVVGSTIRNGSGAHYLFAPLIGDAILLAMRTSEYWDDRYLSSTNSEAQITSG